MTTATTDTNINILKEAHAAAVERGDLDGAARIEVFIRFVTDDKFRTNLRDYCFNRAYNS